ncbi:dihydropteroate synthase [Dyadobacter tibetensis]|uniref:dihydropteroate synthase n=1 Tax=Dyadobacter tibetensis TaxID=1211851 RepID=UPI000471B046|nr:dihydropteroate synthase [Dyadobacter tibetensis]
MPQVSKKTLNVGGRILDLSVPKVMGILNLTPDSFYADSRKRSVQQALDAAAQMWEEGATFLDLGAYSTRPGAADVSLNEEMDRLLPIIGPLNKYLPEFIISIDTFRSEVAKSAIRSGGHMINDISGGTLDDSMFSVVGDLQVPYILMHMRGTPQDMQSHTGYTRVASDVVRELVPKLDYLRSLGVSDIIVDPGFGFAKDISQNFELMRDLALLELLDVPLLAGVSRKSMVWKTLGCTAEMALNGTTALHMAALERGTSILRVHDVRAAHEVIQLWTAITN